MGLITLEEKSIKTYVGTKEYLEKWHLDKSW